MVCSRRTFSILMNGIEERAKPAAQSTASTGRTRRPQGSQPQARGVCRLHATKGDKAELFALTVPSVCRLAICSS